LGAAAFSSIFHWRKATAESGTGVSKTTKVSPLIKEIARCFFRRITNSPTNGLILNKKA